MIKVERSFPAPASLAEEAKKSNGKYDRPDVIERLKKDFHNKCYICELKDLQDPNVEHLLPHKSGRYPEKYLNFSVENDDVIICVKNYNDEIYKRTALLITEVFSLCNTGMRTYTSDKRLKQLQKEMTILYKQLEKLHSRPDSKSIVRMIESLLRRESAFAAFKRCYVRNHISKYPQLQKYTALEQTGAGSLKENA